MVRKIEDLRNKKLKNIIDSTFEQNVDTFLDVEVQDMIGEFIKGFIRSEEKYENVALKFYATDTKKKHWKPKDHFVKIFYHEMKHAEEYYSLTRNEKRFLHDISYFLKWEMNILVDEEDNPLNQQKLAKKLEMDRRTVGKLMKSLEEKTLIFSKKVSKEVYYFVNPYIMYCGKNINILIPKLFDTLGYESCRVNRNEIHKKRLNTGIEGENMSQKSDISE